MKSYSYAQEVSNLSRQALNRTPLRSASVPCVDLWTI
jgi:hypothetical protein